MDTGTPIGEALRILYDREPLGYPYDGTKDLELLRRLRDEYPRVHLADEVRRWVDRAYKNGDTPRSARPALTAWIRKAASFAVAG